ncbi:nucleobase:cation symporter-2 family protein [Pandoraea sp.]|uniref:nucleobase:cation symporter-2 family protein n=1 Tax=Pandoraea sp. TaxID=1883445 RepID=UPI0012206D16|nr:nucleobase:cation symporter-2 family protein [Pandoraea sp.]TAL53251.1 MAG: purine permease [Pandoraea sp.]TAM16618.1 MAG: purine permease [Pandoraea sp.]
MNNATHPVDQVLPARQMVMLGLQHMLVAYIGAIAVPLIVASALKMSQADTIVLISTALFCSGIATLMQTVGFWKFGVRLPILQGVAFSSVGPVIAIGTNPHVGFAGVCGAVIGAGIFTLLAAPFVGRLRRLFPPVVTGCIVTVIGLQLFPVAYEWVGGGRGAPHFGAPLFLFVSLVVLITILCINRYGNPLLRNLAVLIGLIVGALLACGLGMGDYSGVSRAPWVTVPVPFHFGAPVFSLVPIATMIVVMIVQMVESMGLFLAIGDITGKHISEADVVNGLRANGLASAIAGMFAAFPFIAFMENVGLVILTGVRSRWVVAVSGVLMCVIALIPKAGAVFASTPAAALGGAGLAMFGVVVAAGIQTLAKVDYENNRYNVLIVGFTLATALIPVMAPTVFKQLPDWTQPFLNSSVVIACIVSVVLNGLLNGLRDAAAGGVPPLEKSSQHTAIGGV